LSVLILVVLLLAQLVIHQHSIEKTLVLFTIFNWILRYIYSNWSIHV